MEGRQQIERRKGPYVPETVRDYYRDPLRLSGAPFAVIALAGALWVLSWWGLLVAAMAITVSVLIRTWGEAKSQAERIADLDAVQVERDDLRTEVARLETESDGLRRQLAAPELALPNFVHAADSQIEQINIVRKHRQLREKGASDWPVISVSAAQETVVRFVAHATDSVEFADEPVVVLERHSGIVVAVGRAAPSTDLTLEVEVEFTALPTPLQEQYLADSKLDPADFVLRLLGLELRPLADLSDGELADLREKLRQTTEAAAKALGAGAAAPLQLEEST
jgi:hypothetical protein